MPSQTPEPPVAPVPAVRRFSCWRPSIGGGKVRALLVRRLAHFFLPHTEGDPMNRHEICPDCQAAPEAGPDRRDFLKSVGAAAAAAAVPLWATPRVTAAPTPQSAAETAVTALYNSLTEAQKKE